MTHQNAVEELAVERYLLGELTGESRDRFEDHMFDCPECAGDVKAGVMFASAAREELCAPATVQTTSPRPSSWFAWLVRPLVLVPALAACLLVIVYQSAVVMPRMKTEMAETQVPTVLNSTVLANAGARGGNAVAEVVAPAHGFYLLSVDIPPAAGATSYRCALYSPSAALVWHIDVSAQQARDTVTIQVPVMTAQEGMNELRVQGVVSSQGQADKLVDLARYTYKLTFTK
jgi:hypothetical protein